MRVKLTSHGAMQMRDRGIDMDAVLYVLEHFDISMPGTAGTSVKYLANHPDGRRLAVVLVKPLDVTKTNLVKTAHPVD